MLVEFFDTFRDLIGHKQWRDVLGIFHSFVIGQKFFLERFINILPAWGFSIIDLGIFLTYAIKHTIKNFTSACYHKMEGLI